MSIGGTASAPDSYVPDLYLYRSQWAHSGSILSGLDEGRIDAIGMAALPHVSEEV